jgi:hypothetical protein
MALVRFRKSATALPRPHARETKKPEFQGKPVQGGGYFGGI